MIKKADVNSQPAAGVLILAAVAAACPLTSGAQVLNDPMRPPAAVSAAPADSSSSAASAPRLQSVMISPGERSAIIGGERVKLGGKYGDARVTRITENEVVLRSAGGVETLRMYPDIEMNPVKRAATAPEKPARTRRDRQ